MATMGVCCFLSQHLGAERGEIDQLGKALDSHRGPSRAFAAAQEAF